LENLRSLVTCLKTSLPQCRIALLSLGTYGEDLSSPANRCMTLFSGMICELAAEMQVDFLPLHEHFITYLHGKSNLRALDFDDGQMMSMMYRGILLRRFLLRQSFDRIGAANGFYLLSDGLHFNDYTAQIVVELVASWLESD